TDKGSVYPGQHLAIVDETLWDQAHAILAENRVQRANGGDARSPSLLVGIVYHANGERLTPTHAVKKGTRYRYYVSQSLITKTVRDSTESMRIPAANLESLIIGRVRRLLVEEAT